LILSQWQWVGDGRTPSLTAVLVHGRLDLSSPVDIAWQLAQAWLAAQLPIVPEVGHTAGGAMSDHVVVALDRFAAL
jgi:proline iminopeptidase